MNIRTFAAALAGALAAPALGQAPGDIIFTDELNDTINWVQSPGVWQTLVDLGGTDARMAQITNIGKTWYVANGPRPIQNPSTGGILKITDLFGTPNVTTLASGDPLQNPIGLRYSKATKQLISVNHVDSQINQAAFEGVLAVDPASGNVATVFQQVNGPTPIYRAGYRLTPDTNSDDFFITCLNGGVYDGGQGDMNKGSCVWRLAIDPNTLQGSVSLLVDLSFVLPDPLTFVRGIAALPDGDLVIGDGATKAIYRLDLDAGGNFAGISTIATGIQDPWEIVYNPYTKKLVYGEEDIHTLSQMNLDGSGIELLASGVGTRGIAIVPAPGAGAILALAATVAMRRRRV